MFPRNAQPVCVRLSLRNQTGRNVDLPKPEPMTIPLPSCDQPRNFVQYIRRARSLVYVAESHRLVDMRHAEIP